MPAQPVRMLLDCDPGIDDAVALGLAVMHPAIDLVGVATVWGNVDVDRTTRNAVAVLDAFGAHDVEVARGADGPWRGGGRPESAWVHGTDGLGGHAPDVLGRAVTATTAAEHLVATCRAAPGEITIVAVGPLTNLAVALELEPELPELVAGVTVMGGAALAPGNATPAAEANAWFDPTAARHVVAAPWPLTVVPLDATMRLRLDDGHRERLAAAGSPGPRLVAAALDHYLGVYERTTGERRCAVHDALAVGVAAGLATPTLAPTVHADVDDGDGPARGATIFDLRGMYRGHPPVPDAHVTVVLETADGFADDVVATLVGDPT